MKSIVCRKNIAKVMIQCNRIYQQTLKGREGMKIAIDQKFMRKYNDMVDSFEGTIRARNIKIIELQSEIARLTARVKELEDANRWIPVSERLPETKYGMPPDLASDKVEVLYRDKDSKVLWREHSQYWNKDGWVFEHVKGMFQSFDYNDYVVEYWRENLPMPDVSQEGE